MVGVSKSLTHSGTARGCAYCIDKPCRVGPFVTTDLVLVELANSLSQPPYRATAVAVIEKICADRNARVVPFDSRGMEKALALYKGRPDKAWGLVDCFSFVVMREGRLKVALTFDEHFRQAGFEVPLLRR